LIARDGSIVLPQNIMFHPRNEPSSSSFSWSFMWIVQLPTGSSPL
jgi:hypothetical protein